VLSLLVDDRVLLAELVPPLEQTVAYYGADGAGIQVPFNVELLTAAWEARGIAGYIDRHLAYLRSAPGGARYLVAFNLGPRPARLAGPGPALAGRVALSTHPDRDGDPVAAPLDLRGDEGVVVELG
jgi:alpha-glucosidase